MNAAKKQNKLLKRTIVSKKPCMKFGPCYDGNYSMKPIKMVEGRCIKSKSDCLILSCETMSHYDIGSHQRKSTQSTFPNLASHHNVPIIQEPDELDPCLYCYFCPKYESFHKDTAVSPSISAEHLGSKHFFACGITPCGCQRQSISYSSRRLNHRKSEIFSDDWFDNHSIPEYIRDASYPVIDRREITQSTKDSGRFSKYACSCLYCTEN